MSGRASVLLVRHAPTTATRAFRFPADEPLDAEGRGAAAVLAGGLGADRAVTSPALRCRQTARLAGFGDAVVEPGLAELDFGAWAGRDAREVGRLAAGDLEAWYADPSSAPHGGETLDELGERVRDALERLRSQPGTTAVFTHGGPIKVAALSALDAPLTSIWRLDVAPCRFTELHARPGGGWTLVRSNAAVSARVAA